MLNRRILLAALLVSTVHIAVANPIQYFLTVDTSSINGTSGSIDFQFNPGPVPPVAPSTLDILNFTSDGTLNGPASTSGDVSGTLPTILAFDNGAGFNDYFEDFTFGNSLSFEVSLSVSGGASASGSAFAFSMFSDGAGTIPALTPDPNGFASIISVNPDGTTTIATPSGDISVPEPSSAFVLLASSLVAFLFRRRHVRDVVGRTHGVAAHRP